MAMMRGEICGQLASTSSVQGFVDAGFGSYILAIGGDIDGVPNAMEYAKSDRAKQIVELISALAQLGRITAAPPGTSQPQLDALRAAYKSALEDPALLAEAHRKGRPIDPAFGDDVKQLVVAALDQSPEIIQIIRKSLNAEDRKSVV